MATMAREAWTDERLDDLKDGMHREFTQVRQDIDRRFDKVDREFEKTRREIDGRFDQVDRRLLMIETRLDGMQRTLVAGSFAVVAAIIAAGIF